MREPASGHVSFMALAARPRIASVHKWFWQPSRRRLILMHHRPAASNRSEHKTCVTLRQLSLPRSSSSFSLASFAADATSLSSYFPPPEDKGGWRTLLPESGEPIAEQKEEIRKQTGCDWDKLEAAWEHNAAAPGATGLLVIRKGHVVGEWYRGGDRTKTFNIYSSSKSYTSTAFGLILADFGNGPLPDGKKLTLDTKVCNAEWIPESLPLPDPRKAEITVRNLLNMASGIGPEPVPMKLPFETSLGHVDGSPFAKLKGDPGTVFNYSNAGVAHLVLLFNHAGAPTCSRSSSSGSSTPSAWSRSSG